MVDELGEVDQGENLCGRGAGVTGGNRDVRLVVVKLKLVACLAEECDGLLLQLLRVADVAVDDAVEVQTCKATRDVKNDQ